MTNKKYVDEIKRDKELGHSVKIRHIEKFPPKIEEAMEKHKDFERIVQLFESGDYQEAAELIKRYINIDTCKNGEDLRKTFIEKYQKIKEEVVKAFEGEETDDFLKEITDGRYPSYFTLSHTGSAEPAAEIKGGIYVCTYKNIFYDGLAKLYIFGPRNKKFKDYLRKIREAAEEIEGQEFFKGLPLQATKEDIMSYIKSNSEAAITILTHKDPQKALEKYGTNFLIGPSIPVGLTRLNGRVKKDKDVGELLLACFLGGFTKSEEERKNGKAGNIFKGEYYGRDNIEAVTVFYSGLPYTGLGDWGGRIEISPNECTSEVYRNFKAEKYRFGDLTELMIDLKERKVIFFDRE